MEKKTIEQLEKERGVMLINLTDDLQLGTEMTDDEFTELISDLSLHTGVDHEFRVNFLKKNGYEVTRENMMNPDLSTRQTAE